MGRALPLLGAFVSSCSDTSCPSLSVACTVSPSEGPEPMLRIAQDRLKRGLGTQIQPRQDLGSAVGHSRDGGVTPTIGSSGRKGGPCPQSDSISEF
eukprot:5022286-Amphidinium_carterae.1